MSFFRINYWIFILCLAGQLLGVGCARQAVIRDQLFYPQSLDDLEKILVVPLENLTPFPEAGLIVSDLLGEELRAWHGYEVLDRSEVELLAKTGERALPLHWGRVEAISFGKRLEAGAVIVGTISEFGYLREHRGFTELANFNSAEKVASSSLPKHGDTFSSAGSRIATARSTLFEPRAVIIIMIKHLLQSGLDDVGTDIH